MQTRTLISAAVVALIGVGLISPLTGRSLEALVGDATAGLRGFVENTVRPPSATTPTVAPAIAAIVTVAQPLRREITEWDESTGRFDAVETVELKARVNGYLKEVMFKDGQDIKKGDTLFVIDPRPYEQVLAGAKAELEQARVKISNASLDVERARPLLERKIVSGKTFDDRENLMRDAETLERIADEKVKAAALDLSYTRIIAPISGRIGRAQVTPGNYVTPAGASATATTLATIVSQDPIYFYFDITESDALKYKRLAEKGVTSAAKTGAQVEAGLPDEVGFPHQGTIDFLDNRLDQGTGSLRARGIFDNKTRLFTPGQFARIRMQGSDRYTATLVPDEAIGSDQGNRFVVVVGGDDVPMRKSVKLGPLVDGLRVVRDGIAAEDWIVTKGLTRVRPGQKVAPKRETITVSQGVAAGGVTR